MDVPRAREEDPRQICELVDVDLDNKRPGQLLEVPQPIESLAPVSHRHESPHLYKTYDLRVREEDLWRRGKPHG